MYGNIGCTHATTLDPPPKKKQKQKQSRTKKKLARYYHYCVKVTYSRLCQTLNIAILPYKLLSPDLCFALYDFEIIFVFCLPYLFKKTPQLLSLPAGTIFLKIILSPG